MPPPTPEEIFARKVLSAAHLDFHHYRPAPILRRIPACLRALRAGNIHSALSAILSDPKALPVALDSLLIGSTGFFRDRDVFTMLRENVIPDILHHQPQPAIWSAACSDGAEVYSIAMLLDERGARPSRLLGTDCRHSAIHSARAASYLPHSLTDLPDDFRRYFHKSPSRALAITPQIRAIPRFHRQDVLNFTPSGPWDMILCRNLAIYLNHTHVSELWERLVAALVPGGYLVTGKAERLEIPGLTRHSRSIFRKNLP